MLKRFEFFISSVFTAPDVNGLLSLGFYVVYPFVFDRVLYSKVRLYNSIFQSDRVFYLVETVFRIFPNRHEMEK